MNGSKPRGQPSHLDDAQIEEQHTAINEHHHTIADDVEAGNARTAERELPARLGFLRPFYEQAWRYAAEARQRALTRHPIERRRVAAS